MSSSSFASLSAGLLARKGEAAPSKEPAFGHKPWQPPVTPAPPPRQPAPRQASSAVPATPAASVQDMKVRLEDVAQTWPTPRAAAASHQQAPETDWSSWVPGRPSQQLNSFGHPIKTTIRLTHAQARAVKLAALVLDKPQQEILTQGLLERLDALACSDLSKCSCFKAVLEGLKQPDNGPTYEI